MPDSSKLSPWPIRVAVYAAMTAVAIAAIHLIDVCAMSLQREFEQQRQGLPNTSRAHPEHPDQYGSKTTTIQFAR